MRHFLKALPFAVVTMVGCGGSVGIGTGGMGIGMDTGSTSSYKKSVEDWHQGRVERLTAENGWLSLVGLFPIANGEHSFGSASDNEIVLPAAAPAHAGTLTVADSVVTLDAAEGASMTHDGAPLAHLVLASDKGGAEPTEIQLGSIRFYVIDRPGSLYLRVKDADSPVRKNFKGIERYPVKQSWCVEATLDPYIPPHRLRVPNIMGYETVVDCPGALVFKIDGQEYRLEPLTQEGDEWEIVFGDATSGHETYGGGRELYCKVPGPDGKTMLDFNHAYNPPCAFTQFATCPLPHRENVLPFKVEAGEKTWGDRQ